ncbi:MAG: hypothetical protein Q4F13_09145 [Pseudomonadota bacterium]|nr:hypothetical protein [Pseudomonadota bacterium]
MQRRTVALGLLPWLTAGPSALAQGRSSGRALPACDRQGFFGEDNAGYLHVHASGMQVAMTLDVQGMKIGDNIHGPGSSDHMARLERKSHYMTQAGRKWGPLNPKPELDMLQIVLGLSHSSAQEIERMCNTAAVALVPPQPTLELDFKPMQGALRTPEGDGIDRILFIVPPEVRDTIAQDARYRVGFAFPRGGPELVCVLSAAAYNSPTYRRAPSLYAQAAQQYRKGLCTG